MNNDSCRMTLLYLSATHQMDFSAMLMTTVHTSFVWHRFCGLQRLHSLFIVQLLNIKRMLKTLNLFSTCMYGVCFLLAWLIFLTDPLLEYDNKWLFFSWYFCQKRIHFFLFLNLQECVTFYVFQTLADF